MKTIQIILFLSILTLADTLVSGIMLENQWWKKEDGPFIITNDLVIGPKARLTIEPGTEILVERPTVIPKDIEQIDHIDSFTTKIVIKGSIRSLGKSREPIIFKGRYVLHDKFGHWYGIVLDSYRSKEIEFLNTQITGAGVGIYIKRGMPVIRNSIFEYNNTAVLITGKSTARLFHNIFTNNFLSAIKIDGANPYIYNNILAYNKNIGIWGDKKSRLEFKNNLVFGNEERNYTGCNPRYGFNTQTNKNGDSTDFEFNITKAPLFVGSSWEQQQLNSRIDSLSLEESLTKKHKKELKELKEAKLHKSTDRYELSKFSPCIDAGYSKKGFRDLDGSTPNLGIWGGPSFIDFK